MKKNKFTLGWFFISLLMAFAVTACDDEDDNVATVTFPEKQTIGGAASETKSLTFDAVADWTLTSSSTWCYFITEETPAAKAAEGVKEYSISGKAGKQTVTIGISDEGQDYDNTTVASITISMNGQEAVLAEVTRNATGRTLKLYKKGEGDAWVEIDKDEAIEAGYSNYITYKAVANFPFAATNRPEWLDIEGGALVGAANKEVEFGIKVVDGHPEFSKYEQTGNINFQDEEGKSIFTYPVNYKGMNPEAMSYTGPSQWNWNVSLDGHTFTQTSTGVSGTEESTSEYRNFVEYKVTALNDDFEPIFVEKYQEGSYKVSTDSEDEVDWMHMKKYDNGKVRITVDESSEERTGYVFVFPKALYEKIAEDAFGDNGLFEMNPETGTQELKYAYTENNLLMNFVQKDKKEQGTEEEEAFKVTYYDAMWNPVEAELTKVTEEDLVQNYKTELIYSMPLPDTKMGFSCDVLMEGENGSDWSFEVFQGGDKFEDSDEHSITCEDGKILTIYFANAYTLEQEIHIIIKDQNRENKKVLIITPKQ